MAEQKGIITGIGNTITPEIDAVINDFIVNGNTIIKGFENQYTSSNNTNVLSAGMCQLCGYRGVLPTDVTLVGTYVYGKFVLHFDNSIEDEFYIEASNTNRITTTTITGAGTYYLKLYATGVKESNISYPYKSTFSDIATNLDYNGAIGNNVTAVTQPINDNSSKVATTEYVKNQIENDIGYETQTIEVNKTSPGYIYNNTLSGSILLKKKAKYIIGSGNFTGSMTQSGRLSGVLGTINSSFIPSSIKYGVLQLSGTQNTGSSTLSFTRYYRIAINTNGEISLVDNIPAGGVTDTFSSGAIYLGYEL